MFPPEALSAISPEGEGAYTGRGGGGVKWVPGPPQKITPPTHYRCKKPNDNGEQQPPTMGPTTTLRLVGRFGRRRAEGCELRPNAYAQVTGRGFEPEV